MKFESFLQYDGPIDAFLDQDLAKLGDCIVNLIYSLGRSIAKDKPDGAKAPNKVLSKSLNNSGLRNLAPTRVDKHKLGDFTESIIAYAWLQEKIEIKEAAEIISNSFSEVNFEKRKEIRRAAEKGFENLLITISERFSIEEEISRNKT